MTIAEATSKFGVMTLDAAEAKRNSHIHIASRNSDVDDIINDNKAYYDAKDGFSLSNPVADSKYIPLSIPTGGRITFRSIKAIGSSKVHFTLSLTRSFTHSLTRFRTLMIKNITYIYWMSTVLLHRHHHGMYIAGTPNLHH